MANFIPSKKEASDFNNGVQYVNGDSVQAETVNNLVENALYTQAQAESANALVNSVVTDAFAPPLVGMHHIQFSGEPTPAEIWAGTTWEIDTAYQGKTLIGSGGSYALGATGGEATHTLTTSELPSHNHSPIVWSVGNALSITADGTGAGWRFTPSWSTTLGVNQFYTANVGTNTAHNIMQPYTVVNYWKRLS